VQSGASWHHIFGGVSIIGDHCSIRDDRKRFSTILPILSEWFRQWICKGHVYGLPGSSGYQETNLFLDSVLDATFEMTPEQVLDIFLNYLKKSTERQQRDASELFIDCLKEIAKNPSTTGDKK
jgi:hypothetical protein